MPVNISVNIKNYSHCPLKKRPVHLTASEDFSEEPENLSTKPEDLNKSGRYAASPSPTPPSPIRTPPNHTQLPSHLFYHTMIKREPSPILHYQDIKQEPDCSPRSPPSPYRPPIYPEYVPQNWHRNVPPLYPTPYHPFAQYQYIHHEYMGVVSPASPYSDSSCSPPHPVQPLAPLALRPTIRYSSIDQSSLSPSNSSSTISPPLSTTPEDLSEKRRQGIRHQCPECGKSYSTFSGLSKHRQFHCAAGDGPRKSFSCKYCEKVYISLGALKMHIRTHTLPCKCHTCGKAFSRPWLLQGHIRTHTGEKPFSCSYCNRAFADRSNLRAHLQTHSDIKKYSCPTCSKTFSRMSLLTKHAEGGCNGSSTMLHSSGVLDKHY